MARGDAQTVADHLDRIAAVSSSAASAYRSLARLTADRAMAGGLIDVDAAASLLGVLADGEGTS